MRVLALTHAHLKEEGMSPVSCERADSIIGMWHQKLNWDVDVVHTAKTQWRGIWPDGIGLDVNILNVEAPAGLMITSKPELFTTTFKKLVSGKQYTGILPLVARRVAKKVHARLANQGLVWSGHLIKAKKWGEWLARLKDIKDRKYDIIFVCIGFGDEYLLQTALTLSEHLHAPMVVDFRDLWSDHHEPTRFTDAQRRLIHKHEMRMLKNTILISAPQKPMVEQLQTYSKIPVHFTSHSVHIENSWGDGRIISDEFRILYSGKIYLGNPGLDMMLDLLQKLAKEKLDKPVRFHFYVDDVAKLRSLVAERGVEAYAVIHDWVAPPAIWREIRSAHLLITFDAGVNHGMPLLMTKAYQYAYSGRPILSLCKYGNTTYEDFFKRYNAGTVCSTIDDAVKWVKQLVKSTQYQLMPEFRRVPTRAEVAVELGTYVQNILNAR